MDARPGPAAATRRNDGYDGLRDFIVRLEEMGEVEKISGADWKLEIGAVTETVFARNPGRAPALLFDDIPGYPKGFRILCGASSGLRRLALALGLPEPANEIDLVKAYRDRSRAGVTPIPPVEVSSGPVFENVMRDDDVDLWKFPVPLLGEHDGGRYIGTDDVVVMRDPDTGWINAATYRVMVHDRNTVAIWMSPGKHGRMISEKYFAQGKSCPVAISCGQDPVLFLAAHQEIDWELSEYAFAGGQRGRAIEIVRSELHGLPIPADAEIVLEGEMLPDETRREGPFGEFMGYYASPASELPVVRIRRVYWRNDPVLMTLIPSRPPESFSFVLGAMRAAMMWDEVEKAGLPGVQGVWCHEAGAGRLFNVIAIRQMYPGHASQAGMLAANCHAANFAGRWTVVVDEDIDPSNLFDVVWAMSTRCDPPADIQYIKRAWSTPLDPMLFEPPWQNNRAVVDACRPWDKRDRFPRVAEASPELKARVMGRWPHLYK